jgi:cytochrome c biogenesis protein CcmG/thiol:disulfide interchange protein DsbE
MLAAAPRTRPGSLVLVPSAAMGPRFAIAAGLLAGVGVAAILLIGLLALAPEPASVPTPAPSIVQASSSAATPSGEPSGSSSSATPAGTSSGTGAAFHVGEPAPALVVPQVGGGTINLANLKGKPVWVNFMATWCPPCQDEFPLMSGFAARYARTGLVVIAVDVREDEGTVASFAQQLNTTFPLGLDADGAAAGHWAAVALPVHFWIDAKGIVRDGAAGGIGADTMVDGLRSILPGVDVTP